MQSWGGTSDVFNTKGRIKKGANTYAILSKAKPPYTEKSWTSPGTYTWTCPQGVSRIRVAVCGGGGGGATAQGSLGVVAKNGGTSSFENLLQATGGQGAYIEDYFVGEDWALDFNGGAGGNPNGRRGLSYSSSSNGGTGFALSFLLSNGTYGNGGNATYKYGACGGGSGGYNSSYINVNAGSTYKFVVGNGGAKGGNGSAGNAGFVLIAFGGDI